MSDGDRASGKAGENEGSGEGGEAGATSIKLFGVHLSARTVGFLGLVYFANVLPGDRLGVYFLFFVVVQIGSMLSSLGVGQALVQRIGEGRDESGAFSAAVAIMLAVSLLIGGLAVAFRAPLASYVGADVALLAAVTVAAWLLADVHIRTVQGENRVLLSGGLQLLQDVVRVGLGALLITLGYGPRGLMYGVLAGFLVTVLVGYVLVDASLTLPTREDFGTVLGISRYTMVYGPTNFVYFWLDTALIGLFLLPLDVAAYEVAWQTTRVLIIATTAINQTIFPKVSEWAGQGRYEEIERVLPGALIFSLVFPLPGLVGIAVLGGDVLAQIYQPEYRYAALAMTILATYMAVEALQRVVNSTLTGMDRADLPFRSRLIGVALAVVLNLLLIPEFELVGAAVGTFTAKLVDTAIQYRGLSTLLDLRVPVRSLAWQAFSALVMGGVVYLGATTTALPASVPGVLALVGLGVVVYGGLVVLDRDIRQVVEQYSPVPIPMPRLG
jgi:O-antigen/teichoic acid export membrane protein